MIAINFMKNIILNLLSFILCCIIPKNKRYWVIGSWYSKRYADNSRYLYEYLSKNKDQFKIKKIVWITDDDEIYNFLKTRKMDVEKKYSIKGIWISLRAKVHIIDQTYENINGRFSYFSKRFQLWHGVGFKKLVEKVEEKGILCKLKEIKNALVIPGGWNRYCFLSTSEFATKNIFMYSFKLYKNNFIECNYPRNIALLNDKFELDNKQKKIINNISKKQGKILIYMPTYRGNASINGKKEIESFMNFNESELLKLKNYIEKNDITIISKQHFTNKFISENISKNIIQIDSDIDIYPILRYTDALITDYSSIYADYLFLNKPIIFYPYDLESYKNKDKGFLFDYHKVTPGDKVFTCDDLISSIKLNLEIDKYKIEREELKELFFGKDYSLKNMEFLVKKIIENS